MKIRNPFRRKPKEKSWVQTDQGLLNKTWDLGWWQQNRQPLQGGKNEAVEACVSALSQTVSMCPIHHLREEDNGADQRQYGSGPERVLAHPNPYTTRSLFFNSLIRSVYFHGNGYAAATRNSNRAISNLYLLDPKSTHGVIDPESGEVFYWVSANYGNAFNPETDTVYPARDILHVRINQSESEPLKGISPILSAANSIGANSSILAQQSDFFRNSAQPSGIMSTPDKLTPETCSPTSDRHPILEPRHRSHLGTVWLGRHESDPPVLG